MNQELIETFDEFPAIPEGESIVGVMQPTGFHLLVRLPRLDPEFSKRCKVLMTEERRALEEKAQSVVQVMAVGPDWIMEDHHQKKSTS